MLRNLLVAFALALPLAAAPRLSFVRVVPPLHPLPGDDVVIIYAIGDTVKLDVFIETLLTRTSRSDALRLTAVTNRQHRVLAETPDEVRLGRIRRQHPADVYLGINQFTCASTERSAEGSTHNSTGTRVRQRLEWSDAVCRGRVDVIDPVSGTRLSSFDVSGEGTSPRMTHLTNDDRDVAVEQAAHFTGIQAAEMITPRRVRESLELEEHVPDLDRALLLIEAGHLRDARGIWEKALERMPRSAALHYNVAALSEAVGDVAAARRHYEEAERLAPHDRHYAIELRMFRARNQ